MLLGLMDRRRDRARLDTERLRDLPVAEVAVVAEEQDEPLPFGQPRERAAEGAGG